MADSFVVATLHPLDQLTEEESRWTFGETHRCCRLERVPEETHPMLRKGLTFVFAEGPFLHQQVEEFAPFHELPRIAQRETSNADDTTPDLNDGSIGRNDDERTSSTR